MLAFNDIKFGLLYFPTDRDSEYQPFSICHLDDTNWSNEKYQELVGNPSSKLFLDVDWNFSSVKGIVVQLAAVEANLEATLKHCITIKRRNIPVQQILRNLPRFHNGKRIHLPLESAYHSASEEISSVPEETESDTDHEARIPELPIPTPSTQPKAPILKPILAPLPSTVSASSADAVANSSFYCQAGQSFACQPQASIISTSSPQPFHAASENELQPIHNLVRRKGLQPFTSEAAYYLAAITYKRIVAMQSVIEKGYVSTGVASCPVAQLSPEKTIQGVEQFTSELQQKPELRDMIVNRLALIGGRCLRTFIKQAISTVMTNDLQSKFTRHGSDKKSKFKGPLEDLIRQAARKAFPSTTEHDITEGIMAALKNAADREGGRKRRMPNEPAADDA